MGRYRFPVLLLSARIPSFLLGQHRSLREDIHILFRAVGAAPRVVNSGALPDAGPFVLVMNHFHGSDIPSWWPAMAVFKATLEHQHDPFNARIRTIVASQWTFQGPVKRRIAEPLTRFMVGRVARAYDFLTIEPVALGESSTGSRAQSMRHILAAAHAARATRDILCLAPEGGDTPDGALVHPPAGAGRFMLLFAAAGLRFVPAAAYAEAEELIVNFGEPFQLAEPSLPKRAADEWAATQVMRRIAALLPLELRGVYRERDESIAAR